MGAPMAPVAPVASPCDWRHLAPGAYVPARRRRRALVEAPCGASWYGRARSGRRLAEHELVPIPLSFFLGSLFANGGQPLQQGRNLGLVARFSQRLDEPIQRRLIVRVDFQR